MRKKDIGGVGRHGQAIRSALLLLAGLVVVIGGGAVVWHFTHRPGFGAPQSIAQQLQSPAFYPAPDKAVIDTHTYKFDSQNQLLSYVAEQGGNRLVFSMQPSPSELTEIPDSYSKYLDKLNEISSFDTAQGTAYIVEPAGQRGQVAVMNTHGTLLFIHSDHTLPDSQWRELLNSLEQK